MTIKEVAERLNSCAIGNCNTCDRHMGSSPTAMSVCQAHLIKELADECRKIAEQMEDDEKKDYDCSCFVEYPNKSHILKNGKWKCVDKYEKVEDWKPKSIGGCVTHCRRKGAEQWLI